jgi:hypothetical protein
VSEQDLRDCMQQAVWDEPPLDFDPDTFMARAEQLTRRRRALMSVGVATALIIAAVATLPALLTAGRNGVDAARTVTTTSAAPSSTNFPWPPNNSPRRNHTYAEDQPYLIQMWVDHVSPDLQRNGADSASIGTWSPSFQSTGYERDSSVSDVLIGTVSYLGPTGSSLLEITLAGVGSWRLSPDDLCAQKKSQRIVCNVARRPDGSAVVSVDAGATASSGSFSSGERAVYHYRLDGSVTAMSSRSQFTDVKTYNAGHIPMTFDQLTDLATDPAITLER